jgi:hypothetical protein
MAGSSPSWSPTAVRDHRCRRHRPELDQRPWGAVVRLERSSHGELRRQRTRRQRLRRTALSPPKRRSVPLAAGSSRLTKKVVVALRRPLIPYLSRMTSKSEGNDRNRPGTGSTGERRISASAAGHAIGPAQPLKVETRVRTPLGLRSSEAISEFHMSEWPALAPRVHESRRP